jgi:hypothetical protein
VILITKEKIKGYSKIGLIFIKAKITNNKIDQLVYKPYGLTPEEIKIVEGKI